ncbi:MAG: hypothetical protein ACREUG_01195 [Steroidobacteraceae bacterium]
MNFASALEKLRSARTSLEVVSPRDARLTKRLERSRGELARLIETLEQLEGRA